MSGRRPSGSGGSRSGGSRSSAGRPDKSTHAKSGKPRPGTGGYGRKSLEGKGPTPPAYMRPGHPAQRKSSASARAAGRDGARDDGRPSDGGGRPGGGVRGSGDAPEMVAGRNSVTEALRAAVPAVALFVEQRATDDKIREAVQLAAEAGVPVREAGHAELARLTGGAVHQGVALSVRPYDYLVPDELIERATHRGELPLIVALDGVTDPRNLGAVVRSVAAFGGHGVLIPARRSASVTAGAWKASAGALARVPVARTPNLTRALNAYQEAGIFVAGLDGGGDTPVAELPVADAPLALVVGSEGRGLSRLVADRCDVIVRIPIEGRTESLNAGVAAGIALYEVARQRASR
ncbi:MAG: 23S rRNA (guanosine(2251)-2'-O)-methyltransferase RlmB [Actinobacteria bacterium]|nr:23S rRNA (guanosine(2251)-2'-O)-methyltransferase RlmB [Actinomycetota bacterium]